MNILDFLMGPLGWCPRFNAASTNRVEDRYEEKSALLYVSILVSAGLLSLYLYWFKSSPRMGGVFNRNTEVALAFIIVVSIIFGNLATVLWRINGRNVPLSDWRIIRRVFVYSFTLVVVITFGAWLTLPQDAYRLSNPIIYLSYIFFNRAYGSWAVRGALTLTSEVLK
jgi:hypothetical protein